MRINIRSIPGLSRLNVFSPSFIGITPVSTRYSTPDIQNNSITILYPIVTLSGLSRLFWEIFRVTLVITGRSCDMTWYKMEWWWTYVYLAGLWPRISCCVHSSWDRSHSAHQSHTWHVEKVAEREYQRQTPKQRKKELKRERYTSYVRENYTHKYMLIQTRIQPLGAWMGRQSWHFGMDSLEVRLLTAFVYGPNAPSYTCVSQTWSPQGYQEGHPLPLVQARLNQHITVSIYIIFTSLCEQNGRNIEWTDTPPAWQSTVANVNASFALGAWVFILIPCSASTSLPLAVLNTLLHVATGKDEEKGIESCGNVENEFKLLFENTRLTSDMILIKVLNNRNMYLNTSNNKQYTTVCRCSDKSEKLTPFCPTLWNFENFDNLVVDLNFTNCISYI